MDIKVGDKFKVPSHGSEPFYWNFLGKSYEVEDIEVVVSPSPYPEYLWDHVVHGVLIHVRHASGHAQWVPVGVLKELED